jgi:hypothetical protein
MVAVQTGIKNRCGQACTIHAKFVFRLNRADDTVDFKIELNKQMFLGIRLKIIRLIRRFEIPVHVAHDHPPSLLKELLKKNLNLNITARIRPAYPSVFTMKIVSA